MCVSIQFKPFSLGTICFVVQERFLKMKDETLGCDNSNEYSQTSPYKQLHSSLGLKESIIIFIHSLPLKYRHLPSKDTVLCTSSFQIKRLTVHLYWDWEVNK